MALGLGAAATIFSLIVGIYAYRASYQLQLAAAIRSNVAIAELLANETFDASDEAADRNSLNKALEHWTQLPRDHPSMFVCVIGRDGTLMANSNRPGSVGINVSAVKLPRTPLSAASTVGELAAARGTWTGENKNRHGARQLVAYRYSPALDALVVVHTPESAYAAKVRRAILPWVIGFAASTLLMWPLGMLLLNLAYGRARRRAEVAEEARKGSSHLFETIFDQAAIGVAIIHTSTGRIVRANGKYESLIGYTGEELASKSWHDLTHPEDLQSGIERMVQLNNGTLREYDVQKRLIRSDGETIWVHITVTGTCRQDERGKFHVAIVEDITERRQAAIALADSERRFRTLVENAPEAILVLDVEKERFVDFNDNALRMFSATPAQLTESPYTRFLTRMQPNGEDSQEAATELMTRAIAGEVMVREWDILDANGKTVTSELRVVRLPATGRTLLRGSFIDIGERKRVEDKLQQQQTELAHVSRLSVMGEMVAGIAHEINQPLFAISNYAHTCDRLLQNEESVNPKIREWCREIEREATRAAEIIRRLRAFTRKGELRRTPVDVNEAVRETIALLTMDSRQRRVSLRTNLTSESVAIQGDLIGLQQVLINLIRNAYESLETSDNSLRLVTVTTSQGGPFVEVTVHDNGPGFEGNQANKAFDAFYSTKPQGMGMGLAISRTLVEAHGGSLTAINADDGGAILRITLPRLQGVPNSDVVCSHA